MYNLKKISDGLVRVEGVSAEPFLLTGGSCQNILNRFFARKGSYTPEEYDRKRQPYLEAAQIAGWEIVDPEPKVAPVEPSVPVEPSIPVAEPPEQVTQMLVSSFAPVEPSVRPPVPADASWLKKMLAEEFFDVPVNIIDLRDDK